MNPDESKRIETALLAPSHTKKTAVSSANEAQVMAPRRERLVVGHYGHKLTSKEALILANLHLCIKNHINNNDDYNHNDDHDKNDNKEINAQS